MVEKCPFLIKGDDRYCRYFEETFYYYFGKAHYCTRFHKLAEYIPSCPMTLSKYKEPAAEELNEIFNKTVLRA